MSPTRVVPYQPHQVLALRACRMPPTRLVGPAARWPPCSLSSCNVEAVRDRSRAKWSVPFEFCRMRVRSWLRVGERRRIEPQAQGASAVAAVSAPSIVPAQHANGANSGSARSSGPPLRGNPLRRFRTALPPPPTFCLRPNGRAPGTFRIVAVQLGGGLPRWSRYHWVVECAHPLIRTRHPVARLQQNGRRAC